MNAVQFARKVEEEVEKLGPYTTIATNHDFLPPEEATEVQMSVVRDPHHGETDFVVGSAGKRVRRRALASGDHVDEELEPPWRSRILDFAFPWPDPAEAARDLHNTWVASRARRQLNLWGGAGVVELDEPVDGITSISIAMIDGLLYDGLADTTARRAARGHRGVLQRRRHHERRRHRGAAQAAELSRTGKGRGCGRASSYLCVAARGHLDHHDLRPQLDHRSG